MKQADQLKIGQRGLGPDQQATSVGRIVQVIPRSRTAASLRTRRSRASAPTSSASGTLAWISAGKRASVVVPRELTFKRFGLDYVRLAVAGQPIDGVVQLSQPSAQDAEGRLVEVLAGVKPGDKVVRP